MTHSAKKNLLIVGSGGREHALGWKLSQSNLVNNIYHANGNGGTSVNVNISPLKIAELVSFAKKNRCFTIIGPEEPLANGIVDSFIQEELAIFGPTKCASLLESSKIYAKRFMETSQIPTADFSIFDEPERAKDYVVKQKGKLVVKANGLAAGKGVIVCNNTEEAITAIDRMMIKKEFGASGDTIVIEERISGQEASFIAICDGKTVIPLASSSDYKKLYDNDKGENTGGMGSFSPTSLIDKKLHKKIMDRIMLPTIRGMKRRGRSFKGFLYAGLMVDHYTLEPKVLEFNVRMGDPECQPIMMRMRSDLFGYLQASAQESLDTMEPIKWENQVSVCIVMASKGYPQKYKKSMVIRGLDNDFGRNIMIFHAGTARNRKNRIITDGGRVLGITALGPNMKIARDNAYSAVKKISWGKNQQHYRTDVGINSLNSGRKI
jgi:phosphoribosylamine--glycine ligase